jgi:hypothetical protein
MQRRKRNLRKNKEKEIRRYVNKCSSMGLSQMKMREMTSRRSLTMFPSGLLGCLEI